MNPLNNLEFCILRLLPSYQIYTSFLAFFQSTTAICIILDLLKKESFDLSPISLRASLVAKCFLSLLRTRNSFTVSFRSSFFINAILAEIRQYFIVLLYFNTTLWLWVVRAFKICLTIIFSRYCVSSVFLNSPPLFDWRILRILTTLNISLIADYTSFDLLLVTFDNANLNWWSTQLS